MREKVTAIIPTYNEEDNIGEAISSVSFADEVIVIDSYSTDQTVAIAKKQNILLLQRKFDDFSSQKNFAIDRARHNWIYILDADERVSDALRKEIENTLSGTDHKVGYYIYRTFFYNEKKISFSGYQRDKVLRLFNRDYCRYNGDLVHECIQFKGEAGVLKNRIDHYSYRGDKHFKNKLMHYAVLKARSLYDQNTPVNNFHLYIKPPVRFFIDYFLRLGILDGKAGLNLAVHQYHGVKKRYIELSRLYNKERDN